MPEKNATKDGPKWAFVIGGSVPAVRTAGLVAGARVTKRAPESGFVGAVGYAQRRPQVKPNSKQNAHEGDGGGTVREGGRFAWVRRAAASAVVRH